MSDKFSLENKIIHRDLLIPKTIDLGTRTCVIMVYDIPTGNKMFIMNANVYINFIYVWIFFKRYTEPILTHISSVISVTHILSVIVPNIFVNVWLTKKNNTTKYLEYILMIIMIFIFKLVYKHFYTSYLIQT